jgi:hypothetical protein
MKIASMILGLIAVFVVATPAMAAPFKAADKNPNVVAYYESGAHGIPDEPGIYHEGKDLVMRAGKSGNFQQWFYGFANEYGGVIEGDHTVWKLQKDDQCADGWTEIEDAYPEWGDYLEPGADYCVKTNDFKVKGGNHGI